MNENNNTPQFLPAEQLQEVYDQHRYDRRRYRYFDKEGRLAWSNKEGYNHYTWYLYNNEGDIIEMGESLVNAGAAGHVFTVYQCTTAEAGAFILRCAARENVLSLAITPPQPIIAPQPETTTTTPVITTPAAADSHTHPQPSTHPTTGQSTCAATATSTPIAENPFSFADQVLARIFADPQQDYSQHSPSHQTISQPPYPPLLPNPQLYNHLPSPHHSSIQYPQSPAHTQYSHTTHTTQTPLPQYHTAQPVYNIVFPNTSYTYHTFWQNTSYTTHKTIKFKADPHQTPQPPGNRSSLLREKITFSLPHPAPCKIEAKHGPPQKQTAYPSHLT